VESPTVDTPLQRPRHNEQPQLARRQRGAFQKRSTILLARVTFVPFISAPSPIQSRPLAGTIPLSTTSTSYRIFEPSKRHDCAKSRPPANPTRTQGVRFQFRSCMHCPLSVTKRRDRPVCSPRRIMLFGSVSVVTLLLSAPRVGLVLQSRDGSNCGGAVTCNR
jgi:hypothetical protein